MIDLTDFRKRIDWADKDADALGAAAREFFDLDPYDSRIEIEDDAGQMVMCRTVDPAAEAEILDGCERYFGRYLDNMNAAVNYLAYQIALDDSIARPSVHPESVTFPIFNDRDLYREKNRVKQLSDGPKARFQEIQPYNGGFDGLWILHELSRVHRHRLLHTIGMDALRREHAITIDGGSLTHFEVLDGGLLKDETPIVRFAFRRDRPYVEVKADLVFTVGIDHELCRGRDAGTIMNMITRSTAKAAVHLAPEAMRFQNRILRAQRESPGNP